MREETVSEVVLCGIYHDFTAKLVFKITERGVFLAVGCEKLRKHLCAVTKV